MTTLSQDLLLTLHDSDALRTLFQHLGYTPIYQTRYSAQTLDWPDNVATDLRGRTIEVVADVDQGVFQILLLEGDLSLGLQRRLHKTLADRLSEGLLVLINENRDLLDLILLADTRTEAEREQNLPIVFPRWNFDPRAVRPHQQRALEMLDVTGIAGPDVGLHLLRAFKRATQETLFKSQGFISSYYLEQRITDDPDVTTEWSALLPQMSGLRTTIADVLTNTPADAPDRIATALGWERVSGSNATNGTAIDRLRVNGVEAALLVVLPPDAPLEQSLSDTANPSYPQLALIAALEQQKQQNGLSWGILTNGCTWRLYSTLTTSISGVYYEIDLRDMLDFGDDQDLRYFAGFFGSGGLLSQGQRKSFVERVFYASQTLAQQVGEDLKQIVFTKVFPELANGIAADIRRRGLDTSSDEQRQLIFRTTLILLYRSLFLLYAESRRLLPTMHPKYYPHSLTRLLTEIAMRPFFAEHRRKPLDATATWAWDWLKDIFAAVNSGNAAWGVPRYNGGLFSAGENSTDVHKAPHRLLSQTQIGALYLHKALDLLGRDITARNATTPEDARRLIDYAALDVRRLGSIYEGLLEYRLEETIENGESALILKKTRQERKASGSYYTPDYIVAYIVEQAVGPVLHERIQRFEELMVQLAARRTAFDRSRSVDARTTLDSEIKQLEHDASEALLDLKVLDPAMGSGHFLVETVDFLTDRLIGVLQRYANNPIFTRLTAIRADIRASLKEQQIPDEFISDEQLSPARLLRRMVMKRCVYGVDLNDMAVELAKLSLWLHSFTVGAPLSFLDHHLKWGNSLIGARVQQVQQAMEGSKVGTVAGSSVIQGDIFGHNSAFAEMLNLASTIEHLVQIADANGQQVEQSAELYATYEQHVIPVKRLLDLWTSQFFGSKEANQLIRLYSGSQQEVRDLVDALMGRRVLGPNDQRAIERSRELFTQHRFLHWDLDFPEVFIDLQRREWKAPEAAGFDSVVGNPPYVTTGELKALDVLGWNYYKTNFLSSESGKFDLYLPFLEKAWQLTRHYSGRAAYILPNKWFKSDAGKALRNYLAKEKAMDKILDFGSLQVFKGITTYTCICVLSRQESQDFYHAEIRKLPITKDEIRWRTIPVNLLTGNSWDFHLDFWSRLSKKYFQNLDHIANIIVGTSTNADSVFILQKISEDNDLIKVYSVVEDTIIELEKGICVPFLRGKDIDRFIVLNPDVVVLFPYVQGINGAKLLDEALMVNQYPLAWEYLNRHKASLEARENGHWQGRRDWYCHSYARNHSYISSQKLLTPDICKRPSFCLDNLGRYHTLNTVYGIVDIEVNYDLPYILAILNSKLFESFIKSSSVDLRGNYYRVTKNFMGPFPIRRINFVTPPNEREQLSAAGKTLYQEFRRNGDAAPVLEFVEQRLPTLPDGTPGFEHEQSDVVHDLLAFLAERMIDLNQQKQAEARHFIGWLEDETGSRVEEWGNKTAVQEYWAQEWTSIERALQKNRGRFIHTQGLRGRDADLALEPLVRTVKVQWEASRTTLTPILDTIRATDGLIDKIVYRLYGLSAEEIALVESA